MDTEAPTFPPYKKNSDGRTDGRTRANLNCLLKQGHSYYLAVMSVPLETDYNVTTLEQAEVYICYFEYVLIRIFLTHTIKKTRVFLVATKLTL